MHCRYSSPIYKWIQTIWIGENYFQVTSYIQSWGIVKIVYNPSSIFRNITTCIDMGWILLYATSYIVSRWIVQNSTSIWTLAQYFKNWRFNLNERWFKLRLFKMNIKKFCKINEFKHSNKVRSSYIESRWIQAQYWRFVSAQ